MTFSVSGKNRGESRGFVLRYTGRMGNIEERVRSIEERNKSVEIDKAWETSWTRRLLIVAFTYLAIGIFLSIVNVEKPWLAAIVPAIGFTLSTITMPFFKRWWVQKQNRE